MGNGTQMTSEHWRPEIFQRQAAGASGHPARISQSPGSGQDWTETDQSLYGKFLDCWKSRKKKTDLNGLSMRMLRECFLATEDSTICQSSLKWTDSGMISNGRILTLPGTSRSTGSEYTLSDILEDTADGKYYLSKEQAEKIVFTR